MKMRWVGPKTSHDRYPLTLEPQRVYDITMKRVASHLLVVEAQDERGANIKMRYKGTLMMRHDWKRVKGAVA